MSDQPIPIVSVCMITYNHELFICQAIECVIAQKCNFFIELVIGEDYSTDSTRSLCEEYAQKYPMVIKLLPSERNLGMMPNFNRTLQACTGKYIALCEGDDYWTDHHKLQKQVDLLENDNSLSGVFHDVYTLRYDGLHLEKRPLRQYLYKKRRFTAEDVLIDWMGHTCSFVFRKAALNKLDLTKLYLMDWSIAFIVALHGDLQFFPQIMGVYRDHPGGITKTMQDYDSKLKNRHEIYNQLNILSENKYNKNIDYILRKYNYMYELAMVNNIKAFPILFKYWKLFLNYNYKFEKKKNLMKYLNALRGRYYFG